MTSCVITFHRDRALVQERTFTAPAGTQLVDAAAQAGFDLRTHCGGTGTCGKCQVIVNDQKVLACQMVVTSNLDVLVPDASLRVNEQDVVVQTTYCHSREGGNPDERLCSLVPRLRGGDGYGIAVDIGTTTLAAELHDLSGKLSVQTSSGANPQRTFGDDVIARIQKVLETPSALFAMQQLVVGAINGMIAELAEKSGISPQDISIMVVAGNTAMQSILFGIDPSPL